MKKLSLLFFLLFLSEAPLLQAESFGTYTKGCQSNSVALQELENLKLIYKNTRQTHYGQSVLIELLQSMAKTLQEKGLGVLRIGNISMKNGGPLHPYSVSHNLGLDADIAYVVSPQSKLQNGFTSVLTNKSQGILEMGINEKLLTQNSLETLKLFAMNPKVERIMVHPVIKKKVCESFKKDKWMGKIRPWWKHDDHFHVRLACQKTDKNCEAQTPPPPHDDCDSEAYHWWFSEEAENMRLGKIKKGSSTTTPAKPYPKECQEILGLTP